MNQLEILERFKASIDISEDILKTSWEENSSIEFKKSLHTKAEEIDKQYLSTISGLANNKGGILIFGIENLTKELIGIKSTQENLDNRYFSTAIRQGLDGNLDYFFFTGRILSKIIGFLYVAEATIKPVIVKINSSDVTRGEIYFRYPAQTTRIEAADLRKLIDDEIQKRLTATMHAINRIAAIGPEKVALLNTENGEIELDNKSNKLVLTTEALRSLNLIKEGKLVETDGAPAYTLMGEIEVELEEAEKIVEIPILTLTKETEIYKSFFSGVCDQPEMMLEQILLHQSHYAPAFFFIHIAGMKVAQAIPFIEKFDTKDVSKNTKANLLTRISSPQSTPQGTLLANIKHSCQPNDDFSKLVQEVKAALSLTAKNIESKVERTILFNTLLKISPIPADIYVIHLSRVLEALSNLPDTFIIDNKDFVISEAAKAFDTDRDNRQNTLMRKVIANIDMVLYYPKIA